MSASSDLPLAVKAYRYLCFGWMLHEPSSEIFSRAATMRQNRERLRKWLPHYLKVHLILSLGLIAFVTGVVHSTDSVWVNACAAFLCGAEICYCIAIACGFAVLRLIDIRPND